MKTKPIQLPLSTDKAYVLVDELIDEGDFAYPIDINLLKNPFNPTHVEDEYLWFGDNCIACVTGEVNISSYREVIQEANMNTDEIASTQEDSNAPNNAQSNGVEWNGEGLPPVGCIVMVAEKNCRGIELKVRVVAYDRDVFVGVQDDDIAPNYFGRKVDTLIFKPVETESERKERERLEAAYILYCEWCKVLWGNEQDMYEFDDFKMDQPVIEAWLAIVDKTNYRKEK